MEKVNLTFYTVIGDSSRITEMLKDSFSNVTNNIIADGYKTTLILQDDSKIELNLSDTKGNPGFIESHIQGMANYFSQVETANGELKKNVVRQIQVFNCVMGIILEVDDNNERTNFILGCFYDLAAKLNGFLLYPNMHIYNGKGELVFSIKGESQLDSFIPIANSDLLDADRPKDTEADTERKQRSINTLKEQDIPYIEHLMVAVTESEAKIKKPAEILERAIALFALAVYSEVMLSENRDREKALFYVDKVDELYGVKQFFSPDEQAYLADENVTEHQCVQFVWRYEALVPLLWSLGLIEELSYPSQICDVPAIASIFWKGISADDLMQQASPRADKDILDQADLILRYDWACVDARVKQQEMPGGLDSGIVMERHYAFNWLAGANGNPDWDYIQTNT
ncbi:DUF4272 domain-containing protein [Dysgonomonas sp. 521]|uniref:DUF4272 domain-containing protein n=1 Tax=Dysgonomonas sp. 521 TaxID=2302932 RepID=UPI0013D1EE01|nr:DUF4272 domain-containing protein [Dysgonomonas sp. 521]NDV94143.1 DUF4272 domain-containing protein [Dysgonomonas sp. 521]